MKDYTKWEAHWRGTSNWRLSAVGPNGLRGIVFDGVEANKTAVAELVDTLNGRQTDREVLARWIAEALLTLGTLTHEDSEDGGEALRLLMQCGQRLADAVLPTT